MISRSCLIPGMKAPFEEREKMPSNPRETRYPIPEISTKFQSLRLNLKGSEWNYYSFALRSLKQDQRTLSIQNSLKPKPNTVSAPYESAFSDAFPASFIICVLQGSKLELPFQKQCFIFAQRRLESCHEMEIALFDVLRCH